MPKKTKIDWADYVWNPTTGCTKIGAGCKNCYAERMFPRLAGNPLTPRYHGRSFNDVRVHEDLLTEPMKWRKPGRIFVDSMSDLFHPAIPFSFIRQVWSVMQLCRQHTFIVLTKRPSRMLEFLNYLDTTRREEFGNDYCDYDTLKTPAQNVIGGVSVSNQFEWDTLVPILLECRLACRCVSLEPLLGPVDPARIVDDELGTSYNALTGEFSGNDTTGPKINWLIVGGETGHGARPTHPDWVRTLRDRAAAAKAAFYFKQWGEWLTSGQFVRRVFQAPSQERIPQERIHCFGGGVYSARVGKHAAGYLLDGKEHREFPVIGEASS